MKRIMMILGVIAFFLLTTSLECDARIRDEQIALGGIYPGCPFSEVVRIYGEPDEAERKEIPNAHKEGTKYRYVDLATIFVTDEGMVYSVGCSNDNGLSTPDGIKVGTDLNTVKNVYGKEDYYSGHNATAYGYYSDSDEIMIMLIIEPHQNIVKSMSVAFKPW